MNNNARNPALLSRSKVHSEDQGPTAASLLTSPATPMSYGSGTASPQLQITCPPAQVTIPFAHPAGTSSPQCLPFLPRPVLHLLLLHMCGTTQPGALAPNPHAILDPFFFSPHIQSINQSCWLDLKLQGKYNCFQLPLPSPIILHWTTSRACKLASLPCLHVLALLTYFKCSGQ